MLAGNSRQSNFSPDFGEDQTPAYAIVNANAGYILGFEKSRLYGKIGVENLLDAYYSTFGDWNNIPRPGRNFYLNLVFQN